ncbi:MAG: hypothetical protein ABSA09_00605 [Desulfobaccales bacterium]|jgi:hypothetical protein
MSGLMGDSSAGTSGRSLAKTSTLQASYRVTTSVQGLAIPILYGCKRLQPNIFFTWGWAWPSRPLQEQGKGGGRLPGRRLSQSSPRSSSTGHRRRPGE